MEYRALGRTGVKVSKLCLGCLTFGAATEPEDSYDMVDRAIDAGINFLDTANQYSLGKSEEVTGQALKRNGKRDRIVLATKVFRAMSEDDPNAAGASRRHIIEQCEASLKRLQTDYIDLYQIHRASVDVPIDETLRALDDLVTSGKVRYIGTTTFPAWKIVESLWVSKEHGFNRFVSEQPPYNLLDRRIEREVIPMAQTYGFGIIPWSPIAGGLLTGKYRKGKMPAHGRYNDMSGKPWLEATFTAGALDAVEQLIPIVETKSCTMAQFALAWVMNRPAVTSPIIGPRTMEQLEDNLGSLEISFTQEELDKIDAVIPPGRMISPFNRDEGFGPHIYRW